MINEIIEEKNIFDHHVNEFFVNSISCQSSWTIDSDSLSKYNSSIDTNISEDCSDTGMILTSYSEDLNEYLINHNSNLNQYAMLIFDIILKKLIYKIQFQRIKVKRYFWNYYNRSSCGFFHKDYDLKNHCSIIYYLNTCDGYTEIDNKKFFSESGKCILFDSNIMHRGVGPTKDKKRFLLNIVFEYEKVLIK